jgi:hypothetical protein
VIFFATWSEAVRRTIILASVIIAAGGAALILGIEALPALLLAAVAGAGIGLLINGRKTGSSRHSASQDCLAVLYRHLIDMGDALQEVSLDNLQRRGGWDRSLFADVLKRVEQLTPGFQSSLIEYLTLPDQRHSERVTALLAVDRLSAAYTYWTRLFPPRKQDESMFVLSLLQDLSEKVEHAIHLLADEAKR